LLQATGDTDLTRANRHSVILTFPLAFCDDGRGERFGKEVRDALPKAMTPKAFRNAFLRHHPALEPLLSMDAGGGLPMGYALMNMESRIMALVLQRLMDRGIVAFGLHDGLIVGREHAAVAQGIMQETSKKLAGVSIPVEGKEPGASGGNG
jgi:hypothetical protein